MTVPLFPLPNTVLFPGQVLPLYVFEERYRALLARVQQSGEPFGIVQILERSHGSPRPLSERVSPVGTLAHLRRAEPHEDGTSSIVVVGGERFRIRAFDTSQPYLSAEVDLWPLEGDPAQAQLRSQQLLAGLLRAWPGEAPAIRRAAPQEPLLVASYAAALLLAMTGGLAADQCNEALVAANLPERLSRLLQALPASQSVMN